jgi:hypothetical protein
MNRHRRLRAIAAISLAMLLMLLAFPRAASAKGPFGLVIISGGGLAADIEVTDRHLLDFFSFSDFYESRIEAPSAPGLGYVVSRGSTSGSGTFVAWDRLRYYPGADGQPGYVYYEGLVNGSSEYDGHWYRASANAEQYMLPLLAGQPRAEAPAPSAPPVSPAPFVAALALSALLAAGLAAQTQRGKTMSRSAG